MKGMPTGKTCARIACRSSAIPHIDPGSQANRPETLTVFRSPANSYLARQMQQKVMKPGATAIRPTIGASNP